MYILFNKDGSIFDTNVSEYVMQGSNLVNVIYVAFVDSEYLDWSASGNFTLPDESNSVLVGVSTTFLYKGVNYTGWKITLTNNETKYNGTLKVSINLIKNEQILYTYLYNITINETGYPLDGEWNVNINYAQFNTLMAQIATKFGVGTTALTVEELPLQGSENIIYYLDKNGYYEQYMFNGSEYVLLGTTIFKSDIPTINVSNSGTFSEGDYQTLEENHTISLIYLNNECILHQAKSALDTTSLYFVGITTNNNVVPTFICLKVLENRNYTLTIKQLVDTDSEQTLTNKTISNSTINGSTINGTDINNSHLNNTTSTGTFKVQDGSITFGEESDTNQTSIDQDGFNVKHSKDVMSFKAGVLDYSKDGGEHGYYRFNGIPNQNVYIAYSASNENSNIDNSFTSVKNDIASAKGDISSLQSLVNTINSTYASKTWVQEQGYGLQSDIDDINSELSTINGSITTIKNDVSTLKSNVSTLQTKTGSLESSVGTINGEIDTINSDLDKKLNKLQLAQGNLLYARVNGIDLGAVYDTQAQANTIVARDAQGHVIGATPTDPTHLTTKSYVDSAIGSVSTISFSIVNELPSTGESNIIYLVPNTTSSEKNVYDEYIWVNNAFEIIGSTAIDLTNYAKLNSDNIFTGVQYFNNTNGILIDGFKLNNAFLTNWQTKINKIDGIETDITSIENDVNSLTTKVSANTQNINTINGDIDDINTELGSLKTNITNTQQAVLRLNNQVETNTSDIAQIQTDLNNKIDKTSKAGAYVNQGDSVLNIPLSYAPIASAIARYNGAGTLRSESVDWNSASNNTVVSKSMYESNFKDTYDLKAIPTIDLSDVGLSFNSLFGSNIGDFVQATLSGADYEPIIIQLMQTITNYKQFILRGTYSNGGQGESKLDVLFSSNSTYGFNSLQTPYIFEGTILNENGRLGFLKFNMRFDYKDAPVSLTIASVLYESEYVPVIIYPMTGNVISSQDLMKLSLKPNAIVLNNTAVNAYCIRTFGGVINETNVETYIAMVSYGNSEIQIYNPLCLYVNLETGEASINDMFFSVYPTANGNFLKIYNGNPNGSQEFKSINGQPIFGHGDLQLQETLVSGTNIKTVNNQSLLGSGNIDVSSEIPTITISSLSGTLSDSDYEKLVNSDMVKIKSPLGSFTAFKYTLPNQQNNLYYYVYQTDENGTTCYSLVVTNGTTKTFVFNDYTVGGSSRILKMPTDNVSNNTEIVSKGYLGSQFTIQTTTVSQGFSSSVQSGEIAGRLDTGLTDEHIIITSIYDTTNQVEFMNPYYDGTEWRARAICVVQSIGGISNVEIKYIKLP